MKGPQLPVFNFSIKNEGGSSVDIFIDSDIVDSATQTFYKEYFGDDTMTSYKSFRDLLNKIDASIYNVYINSPGGQVTEAMAIHDLLQDMQKNGKTVNTIGRGIIASSATYILMASKNPVMSSNSWMMIHNVSGFCYGDVNECEAYVATMRKFNDATNQFYQNCTGLSKTVISNMMNEETWMTADEAKSKGFVKNVTGEASFSNSIKPEQWQFNNTAVLNSYNSFTNSNSSIMDTKKITDAITNGFNAMLEKLGLKDKAGDEGVKNAFTEFSTSVTNAITEGMKEIKVPDNEAITKMVTDAVANSLKTVPENFTKAITDATKDMLTKDHLTEQLKNSITKEDFKKQMDELTNSIVEKLGGSSDSEKGDPDKIAADKKNKAGAKRTPGNRFRNVEYWTEN